MAQAIILMGVTGSGKTTVGRSLSEGLGWPFYDADDFHPPSNVEKMHAGIPLTDEDRKPWLAAIANLIAGELADNRSIVLACSALKQVYRQQLIPPGIDPEAVRFVFLRIPPEVAAARLAGRSDHFMPPALVPSQFATLEEPTDAIAVDATRSPDEIVAHIRRAHWR